MSQLNNILDFEGFKLQKKISLSTKSPMHTSSTHEKICPEELDTRISNIKESIHRINKLMAELKSISEKPNN